MATEPLAAALYYRKETSVMDEPKPRPKPHKLVLIFDRERLFFAAFADEAQEKKILKILVPHTRIAH